MSREAARQVARPIFFATAIIITAYLPLFAFQRVEAKLFSPMAYAVGYAQFGALLFALHGDSGPRLSGLSQAAARLPQSGPRIGSRRGYRRALAAARCAGPAIAYLLSAGAAVAVVVCSARRSGANSCPSSTKARSGCMPRCRPAFRSPKATEMAAELRRAVGEFPEVSYIVTHLGRNDDGTDPWTPSHIEAAVGLSPYDTWPAGETKQDLIRRMTARLAQLPGFEIAFSQPIIDSVLDKVFDPHSALGVKIFGDDFDELRRIGQRHRRRARHHSRRHRRGDRSVHRRCRRSRSRSIARRPRATASTSRTSPT